MAVARSPRAIAAVALLSALAVSLPPSATSSTCPVSLLSTTAVAEDGLRLEEEGLNYLATLPSPLYLVPMLGVYRGGKSLVLCRLLGLQAPYRNGFQVGHTQETFTRGIHICAEEVKGLGTVVWMDTEGLFSSEDARGAYGSKIFSLAMLISSVVLLNSVKVFSEQFVVFFAEQQRVARVLKKGIASQGLPLEALLPGNLSIFWVLQQPVHFNGSVDGGQAQIQGFLSRPGDESRERVLHGFQHFAHEVPVAASDTRTWGKLEDVADEELAEDYVAAVANLRERVLAELHRARPLQVASVVKLLQLYLQAVQTENFSASLAVEAFEQAEAGAICANFSDTATDLAGSLPSRSLEAALISAGKAAKQRKTMAVESFHFGRAWAKQLDDCLQAQSAKLQSWNAEAVLTEWRSAVGQVAESGGAFFQGALSELLEEFGANYGRAFSGTIREEAVRFASALQRTRLVDSIRIRDVLLPFIPWLAWPVFSIYLQSGMFSGLFTMTLHALVFSAVYTTLLLLNRLPGYADINYPVLQMHPFLFEVVMRSPPMLPWNLMIRLFSFIGVVRSAWKLLQHMFCPHRSTSQDPNVAQLIGLELELNILLANSEAATKRRLTATALDAAAHLDCGQVRMAAVSLLRCLMLARDSWSDYPTGGISSSQHEQQQSVKSILRSYQLPSTHMEIQIDHNLFACAVSSSCEELLEEVLQLLSRMAQRCTETGEGLAIATSIEQGHVQDQSERSSCSSPDPCSQRSPRSGESDSIANPCAECSSHGSSPQSCTEHDSAASCSPRPREEYTSPMSVTDSFPDPDAEIVSLMVANKSLRRDSPSVSDSAEQSSKSSCNYCNPDVDGGEQSCLVLADDSSQSADVYGGEQSRLVSADDGSKSPAHRASSTEISGSDWWERNSDASVENGSSLSPGPDVDHSSPVSPDRGVQHSSPASLCSTIEQNLPVTLDLGVEHSPQVSDWWDVGAPLRGVTHRFPVSPDAGVEYSPVSLDDGVEPSFPVSDRGGQHSTSSSPERGVEPSPPASPSPRVEHQSPASADPGIKASSPEVDWWIIDSPRPPKLGAQQSSSVSPHPAVEQSCAVAPDSGVESSSSVSLDRGAKHSSPISRSSCVRTPPVSPGPGVGHGSSVLPDPSVEHKTPVSPGCGLEHSCPASPRLAVEHSSPVSYSRVEYSCPVSPDSGVAPSASVSRHPGMENSRSVSPVELSSPASDAGLKDCRAVWPGVGVETSLPVSLDHGVQHRPLSSADCGMEHRSTGSPDRGAEHSLPGRGMEDICPVSLSPCMEHLSRTDHGLEPSSPGSPGSQVGHSPPGSDWWNTWWEQRLPVSPNVEHSPVSLESGVEPSFPVSDRGLQHSTHISPDCGVEQSPRASPVLCVEHNSPVSPEPCVRHISPGLDWWDIPLLPTLGVVQTPRVSPDPSVEHSCAVSPNSDAERSSSVSLDRSVEHSPPISSGPGVEHSCSVSPDPGVEHSPPVLPGLAVSTASDPGLQHCSTVWPHPGRKPSYRPSGSLDRGLEHNSPISSAAGQDPFSQALMDPHLEPRSPGSVDACLQLNFPDSPGPDVRRNCSGSLDVSPHQSSPASVAKLAQIRARLLQIREWLAVVPTPSRHAHTGWSPEVHTGVKRDVLESPAAPSVLLGDDSSPHEEPLEQEPDASSSPHEEPLEEEADVPEMQPPDCEIEGPESPASILSITTSSEGLEDTDGELEPEILGCGGIYGIYGVSVVRYWISLFCGVCHWTFMFVWLLPQRVTEFVRKVAAIVFQTVRLIAKVALIHLLTIVAVIAILAVSPTDRIPLS